jgi:hypothetical protein
MAENYTKEQLWELYEQLPEPLKKAVFSEEIGSLLKKIIQDNGIKDKEIETGILKKLGYVFLGILSPEELKIFLKNDAIFARINNEILLTLKADLDLLYGIKLEKISSSTSLVTESIAKEEIRPKKSDKYLEPIE